MNQIELKLNLKSAGFSAEETERFEKALAIRAEVGELIKEEKYLEAMERNISALKIMREHTDYHNSEFRLLFVALLFDLAEIHYALKNYKQSEKEVETLFKVLDNLVKTDEERFGPYHILAMELSTRILRSRKKALDLLVKQQITTGSLFDKVNSGVVAATDKLVDSLCKSAKLLASTGDIRESLKFYAEAIKLSKKRTGRLTPKEIRMSVQMAEVMMRLRSLRPRAKRLLSTILPHAEALKEKELEREIKSLLDIFETNAEPDSKWRLFLHKVISGRKDRIKN